MGAARALKVWRKTTRTRPPRTAYVFGTCVRCSRVLRTGYFVSCGEMSWVVMRRERMRYLFVELGVVVLSLVLYLNEDWVLLDSLSGGHDGGRGLAVVE